MNLRTGHMQRGLENIITFLKNQKHFEFSYALEIGSFRGDSARVWGKHFSVLCCIDPWLPETTEFIGDGTAEEVEAAFDKVQNELARDYECTVYKQKQTSRGVTYTGIGGFNFVYIDGDHRKEECLFDILYWGKRAVATGYIAVHDVGVREGVNEAIRTIWPKFPEEGYITNFCDTSIIFPAWMIHNFINQNMEFYNNVTNKDTNPG